MSCSLLAHLSFNFGWLSSRSVSLINVFFFDVNLVRDSPRIFVRVQTFWCLHPSVFFFFFCRKLFSSPNSRSKASAVTILVPFSLNLFPGMLFSPPGEETETLGTRLFNRYVQWSSERRRSALITVDKTTLITVDKSARKRFFWQDRPRMEDIISDVVITSQLRWHMENRHSLVRSEKNPLTSLKDSKVVCSSPYACAK